MGDEFSIDDLQTLRNYLEWMDVVADDLRHVSSYVVNTVCADDGYPRLMEPVVEALDVAAAHFQAMTFAAIDTWETSEQALFDIARAYDREDGHVSRYFRHSDAERELELIRRQNELRQRKIEKETGGLY